eukprot:17376_1
MRTSVKYGMLIALIAALASAENNLTETDDGGRNGIESANEHGSTGSLSKHAIQNFHHYYDKLFNSAKHGNINDAQVSDDTPSNKNAKSAKHSFKHGVNGYFDDHGNWVSYPKSAAKHGYKHGVNGYFDDHSNWVSYNKSAKHGYYDDHGNWVWYSKSAAKNGYKHG